MSISRLDRRQYVITLNFMNLKERRFQ